MLESVRQVEVIASNRVRLTRPHMRILSSSYRRYEWLVVASLLGLCVFAQMFSEPVTPLNEPTIAGMLTESESESEDPSLLPPVPELRPSSVLSVYVVGQSTLVLPVLATSIFHPPLI